MHSRSTRNNSTDEVKRVNLNASVAAQIEIKLSWVSDSDVDRRSSRYVTTLALLDTQTNATQSTTNVYQISLF